MINRILLFLLVMVLGASGALIGAQSVKAASLYDDDMQITTTLHLSNNDGDSIEVEYQDLGVLTAEYCSDEVLGRLNTAISSGTVVISQTNLDSGFSSGIKDHVNIYFNPTANLPLVWGGGYVEFSPAERIQLYITNGGLNYGCYNSGAVNTGGPVSTNPTLGWNEHDFIFASTANPNYPPDYEGPTVPTEPGESTDGYTPKIGYTLFDDMRLQALPYNPEFCLPTTLGGCLEPYYKYTLTTGVTQVDQKILKQNEFYKYQYLDKEATYILKVEFAQPGPPAALLDPDLQLNAIQFTIVAALGFQSNSPDTGDCELNDGVLDCGIAPIADLTNCFDENFPYVDLVDCVDNMKNVITLLSFNTLKFGNSWQTPDGCHTLTVIGDWLNLTNRTICPQIPQAMRDIITPFITLGLGLTTVLFLGRREGYYD